MSAEAGQSASLVEVFSSVQGEGPEVGRTTVFVRFGGCDLRCRWCDSPGTWRAVDEARLETAPGARYSRLANPIGVDDLADRIDVFAPTPGAWISLRGASPVTGDRATRASAAGRGAGSISRPTGCT